MQKRGSFLVVLLFLILSINSVSAFWPFDYFNNVITGKTISDLQDFPYSNSATCFDSDGGIYSKISGTVKYNRIIMWKRVILNSKDSCDRSGELLEYFCDRGTRKVYRVICQNGCSNGVCISSCRDSDANTTYPDGRNIFVKSTADNRINEIGSYYEDTCLFKNQTGPRSWQYVKVDSCEGENCIMQEGFCSNGKVNNLAHICPEGLICRKGACEPDLDINLNLIPNHEDSAISIQLKMPAVNELGNYYIVAYRTDIQTRNKGWAPFLRYSGGKEEALATLTSVVTQNIQFSIEPDTEYVFCIEELFRGSLTDKFLCKSIKTASAKKSTAIILLDENVSRDKNLTGSIYEWISAVQLKNPNISSIEVINLTNSQKKEEILKLLKQKYKTSHLDYVILVGWNFPFLMNTDGKKDYEFKCLSIENFSYSDWLNMDGCENEVVLALMKPPIGYEEGGRKLLQDYLDRLLLYYKGGLTYDKAALLADFMTPIERGMPAEYFYTLQQRYNSANTKNITIVNSYLYAEHLKNKSYELLFFNAHGDSLSHWPGIDRQYIIINKPRAKIILPISCSVGDYTVKNYVAGSYIFDGDSLAMAAASVPLWVSKTITEGKTSYSTDYIIDLLVNKNKTIGQATKDYGLNIIGDPFIKIA